MARMESAGASHLEGPLP